ncbi:uncharacterized protein LOC107865033 [Capsicum annuum]|uniref:uncharacterized protein LOC107865033 n=1 Tax=Capsicum annuum TaxID=4072 RepID=UPI0007BEB51F|nr:uncharacterized protein LOC107865033 [Capsicum annuum]
MILWNKAVIIKHLWALALKKDCLWIRWMHCYYIMYQTLEHFQTPKNVSWVIRKVLNTRKLIMELQQFQGDLNSRLQQFQQEGKFSTRRLYLLQIPQYPKMAWKKLTLQPHLQPSHKFNFWLAVQIRLATVDRLLKLGIQVPKTCVFCGAADEVFDHLFFECNFTKNMLGRLLYWLGITRRIGSWNGEIEWLITSVKLKSGHRKILVATFIMLIYGIWKTRNLLRFQNGTCSSDKICRDIAIHIHTKGANVIRWKE